MHTKFKDVIIGDSFFTDALPDPDNSIEYVKVSQVRAVVAPWMQPTKESFKLSGVQLPFHDEEMVINSEEVPF